MAPQPDAAKDFISTFLDNTDKNYGSRTVKLTAFSRSEGANLFKFDVLIGYSLSDTDAGDADTTEAAAALKKTVSDDAMYADILDTDTITVEQVKEALYTAAALRPNERDTILTIATADKWVVPFQYFLEFVVGDPTVREGNVVGHLFEQVQALGIEVNQGIRISLQTYKREGNGFDITLRLTFPAVVRGEELTKGRADSLAGEFIQEVDTALKVTSRRSLLMEPTAFRDACATAGYEFLSDCCLEDATYLGLVAGNGYETPDAVKFVLKLKGYVTVS